MTDRHHRLLLASAGTGKTYQLSGQFLDLLFEGRPPESILATTFTRKAAGEILDRVLERLLEAIRDDDKRDELGRCIGRSISAAGCRRLLAGLVRRLDRFQVRTLDSFFVHLARLFALDLGLPPDWSIADRIEDEEVRAHALSRALAECGPEERLELLRGVHRGAASRSVHGTMLEVVRQIRDVFLESDPASWRCPDLPEPLDENQLARWQQRLGELECPLTARKSPVVDWQKAYSRIAQAVESGDWNDLFAGTTLVETVLSGGETFSKKPIGQDVREVISALARHGAARLLRKDQHRTEAAHRFLRRFEGAYQALKRERQAYQFEDLPRSFNPPGGDAARPIDERQLDLWFRLDGCLDHLLLDEFQDTAPSQWRVLQPMADEILAGDPNERTFFCVGDVKQSIYGWRAAEPRLLAGLAEQYRQLVPESLTRSFRSSQVILDTVNQVFGRLDRSRHVDDRSFPGIALLEWQARYETHRTARDELKGDARLLEAPPLADGSGGSPAALEYAVERIRQLVDRAPGASIGVLVRSNRPIPKIIHRLREHGIRASGEGGNPLVDAESVQVFLSTLQLADHPGDSAAAFHVTTSPLAGSLGLGAGESIESAARWLRRRLLTEGYGVVCAGLLEQVEQSEQWGSWDVSRFRQLVDLAFMHDSSADLRPSSFVRRIRETPVEDPSAARVRVMTIHGAKGLEFDAVVLPQLEGSLVKDDDLFVHDRADPFGPITRVAARPKRELLPFSAELAGLVAASSARILGESLCVLYVAMTRARHCLEMVLPPSVKGESTAKNFANLLGDTLGRTDPDEAQVVWRHPDGQESWSTGFGEDEELPAAEVEHRSIEFATPTRPRAVPARTASGEEGGVPGVADLLRPANVAATTRGTLIHRWTEEIEWLDGFAASDVELLEIGASLQPDLEARRDALLLFRESLERPAIRSLLTRPTDEDSCEVRNEHPFALLVEGEDGQEQFWRGFIDRLVLRRQGDRVVAVEVIDFKSDAVAADATERLAERVVYYRPQLEAYRRVIALQYDLQESEVAARLAFLQAGVVVDC